MDPPEVLYARSGDVSIAYQVLGKAPLDLVLIRGSLSQLTSVWEQPLFVRHLERLTAFSRVLMFDKRGMGLSDRLRDVPTLEARMDDVRAVMDDAASEEAVLFAAHEGARIAVLFGATYPERTAGLVLYDPFARGSRSDDYPWAPSADEWRRKLREVSEGWGKTEFFEQFLRDYCPSVADEEFKLWYVRHMRQSASPGAAVAFQRMVMEGDVSDVLPAIRVPTLVLHRSASAGSAAYVADRIPGSLRKEIPNLVDGYSWVDPESNGLLLDEIEAFVGRLGGSVEAERVLGTFLFTDIVGSTEHAATLGDAEWKRLLGRHHALVRRRLGEFRGEELNTTGDGFLASFDGPGRAIRCACAVRDDLGSVGIDIRAGLHTGEAERLNGDVGGIAVHTAARVASLAGASEVLVSSTVKDLVAGSGIEFDDRDVHTLKGVPGEWRLFAVR